MSWQVGDTVGSYQITGTLGSGGMATVYRAQHERLGREAAIKVLHPSFVTDDNFIARFEREAQIVARLDHPNIVPVYDFDEKDGQPYLVMKYIQGRTLKQHYFKHGALRLDEIERILKAVAEALTYAHQQGVLHRDVKPSNIILDGHNIPHLTDFGLARILQSGETTMSAGMILGTPNYISPEQASDEGQVTERSDVYSLGVVLYEMVVGRVPFESKTPYATIHKHIYEPPPLPSEVNPEIPTQVELVLLKVLEKDPDLRYQTPDELAAAFEEAVRASGLTELSPDRSTARMTQERPPIASSPAVSKPKRELQENSLLLLLDDEDSWAHLPQQRIAQNRLKKRRDEMIGFIGHLLPYIGVNAAIIFGSVASGDLEVGTFITLLAWGAGLAAHGIHTYYQSTRQTNRLYSDFYAKMDDEYGAAWRSNTPYEVIQQEWRAAKERQNEWEGYWIHSAVYVLINLMLWMIFIGDVVQRGTFYFPWPAIVTMGWMVGLIAHGVHVRSETTQTINDESVESELAMMQGGAALAAKPKRQQEMEQIQSDGVRLTEDGELTDSMVSEFEEEQRRARR